jgi:ethylbenzene dioxygenase beta subunit
MHKVQSGVGVLADSALRDKVIEWLLIEAEMLDGQREREWLENMASKNLVYELPLRQTVERSRGGGFVPGAYHLVETWGSLNNKLKQHETGHSWAEDPQSRTRHFVSNVRVGQPKGGKIEVRSNLLLYRTRQDEVTPQFFSGERHDILGEADGTFLLEKRTVYLDTTAITSHNLAIIF